MPLFKVCPLKLEAVPSTAFANEGMMERKDLQRLLRADITPLGTDLLVLAEEFGDWEDSKRRIDLLCIDKEARLVVVEIKRTDDGGHMELQAIRYAAMISSMTVEQAISAYAKMLGETSEESAKQNLLAFLDMDSLDEVEFEGDVRIILVAADFSTEVTTSVMWLNKYDLDITCVRLKPYKLGDHILVDVTQIIPLPEAAEYEVKIRAQAQEAKKVKSARHEIFKRFWLQLIDRSKPITALLANRSTTSDNWLTAGIGKAGFTLILSLSKDSARVECYIRIGQDDARSEAAFTTLAGNRAAIEAEFGGPLEWQDLPGRLGCRICKNLEGGWQTVDDAWPALQINMIKHLVQLEKALKGPIHALTI